MTIQKRKLAAGCSSGRVLLQSSRLWQVFQMLMEIMFDSKSTLKSSLTYLFLIGLSFGLTTVVFSLENPLPQRGGAKRQWSRSTPVAWFPLPKTPLESPLVQGGTLSSNVAPQG